MSLILWNMRIVAYARATLSSALRAAHNFVNTKGGFSRVSRSTIRVRTIRVRTIRVRTIRMRTIRVRTIRVRTIRVRTIRVRTIRVRTIRVRTIRVRTCFRISPFPRVWYLSSRIEIDEIKSEHGTLRPSLIFNA